ncbi:MAG: cell division protein FtsH, partial [bacterium]|nr:cell division protein FtsH [bacterium]
ETEITAYHEAGHCLLGWTLPGAHRVHKVTIIPRGRAAGLVQSLPEEDKMNHSQSELIDILTMTLGGRAAEQVIFNELSVGAQQDLEQATSIARRMVTLWGMSKKLGPVSYKMNDEDPFLGREMHQQRPFSDHTMELIDEEVAKILHESADRAVQLLKDNREQLETLAQGLLDSEELEDHQIAELIGPSIHSQMDAAETNGKPSIVQSPTEREAGSTNNDS